MSLQGDLQAIPLADVMQMIASNRRSGTLYVTSVEAARVVTFSQGVLTTASSLEHRFLLGTVLCRKGTIDPYQLAEALEKQKSLKLRLGDTLLQMGLVTEEDLTNVVRDQVQNVMNDVFRWRLGGFLFAETDADLNASASVQGFHVQPMLMEALRASDAWEEVSKQFDDRDAVPRLMSPDEVPHDGHDSLPSGDALTLLELIDGFRSVGAIILKSGWSDYRAITALADVMDAGLACFRSGATSSSAMPHFQAVYGHHVPVMPRAGARAVAMATSEEVDERELRELALSDPGLAVTVLRTAGALGHGDARVRTISQGIKTIGPEVTRRALVGGGLRGLYASEAQPWKQLWRHSVATAVAARLVARLVADDPAEIEVARLAGLCHDIGCHLLRHSFPEAYETVLRNARDGMRLLEAERKQLGVGHDSVGAHALESWGASEAVREAVLHHHAAVSTMPRLAAIVSLANGLAAKHGFVAFPKWGGTDAIEAGQRLLQIPDDAMRSVERRFIQTCAARDPLW